MIPEEKYNLSRLNSISLSSRFWKDIEWKRQTYENMYLFLDKTNGLRIQLDSVLRDMVMRKPIT